MEEEIDRGKVSNFLKGKYMRRAAKYVQQAAYKAGTLGDQDNPSQQPQHQQVLLPPASVLVQHEAQSLAGPQFASFPATQHMQSQHPPLPPFNSFSQNAIHAPGLPQTSTHLGLHQAQHQNATPNSLHQNVLTTTANPSMPNIFAMHHAQQSLQVNGSFPPPPRPPGPILQISSPKKPSGLLSADMLAHIPTRAIGARTKFGAMAVKDARKGLSRVLDATDIADVEMFGDQLRCKDQAAIEMDWEKEDRLPIFAISYVQRNPPVGRFKFDGKQWQTFLEIVQELASCGVKKFRVWLDQCLWVRDASQGSWAHTGLLPYVMWPVICLGRKKLQGEKSVESDERMWPFLEELSGLWGMGVVFGREMRSKDASGTEGNNWRKWVSYVIRARLEPVDCMTLLLLNIYHGAVDTLKTGWVEDVQELKEMARANVMVKAEQAFIGSDWKERIAQHNLVTDSELLRNLALPAYYEESEPVNLYIEASRTLVGRWHGVREWLSGNEGPLQHQVDLDELEDGLDKWNVRTNIGEFQILRSGGERASIWLLVAMDGLTSHFSIGKVAWTKVMTGIHSSLLGKALEDKHPIAIGQTLSAEIRRNVRIESLQKRTEKIQWE